MNYDRFRYRCWDNHLKEFVPNNDFFISPYGLMEFREGKHRGEWSSERYQKEQGTGLKDKDGVLIFEGDIVRFPTKLVVENKDVDSVGHVVWDDSSAWWGIRVMSVVRHLDYKSGVYCMGSFDALTVVGNIRENPELLESSDEQ